MFSFEQEHTSMNNTQALRAILNAIHEKPDSIDILIHMKRNSGIFLEGTREEVAINVRLQGENNNTHIFTINALISYQGESNVGCLYHQQYDLLILNETQSGEDGTAKSINFTTINPFGQIYKENEVTLSAYDLEDEIQKIFEIMDKKPVKNDEALTITYTYLIAL